MKLLVYGDSLSNGNHGDHAYYKQLEEAGYDVTNRAVGSSGLCRNTPNSMLQQMDTYDDRDYELVLCWHGTNDWYWGSDIGDFEASMVKAVETIRVRNPYAFILWFGPLYRYEAPDGGKDKVFAFSGANKVGKTLVDYIKVIKGNCEKLGVRYVDMNSLVQIHKENADHFLEDGVHPNALGYERIAHALVRELAFFKDAKVE